jgi:hypothetical protein
MDGRYASHHIFLLCERADCSMDNVNVSAMVRTRSASQRPAPLLSLTIPRNFNTYVPNCWQEATGPISGPTTFGSSGWKVDGFANAGTTGSAAVEIYLTGGQEWLLSPTFNLSAGGYELNFDVASHPMGRHYEWHHWVGRCHLPHAIHGRWNHLDHDQYVEQRKTRLPTQGIM